MKSKKPKKSKKSEATEDLPLFAFKNKDNNKDTKELQAIEEEYYQEAKEEKILSVTEAIELVNQRLKGLYLKIKGEVGRFQIRGTYAFFTLRDSEDENVLNCFVWKNVLDTCGVNIKEGMEIAVSGYGEIYARTGGFNFQVKTLELVGEGALKKAFEELKEKLEKEGLFAPEVKKPLPEFPQRIALVTSRHGEAINDFTTNVGQFGFKISFKDSRVEGQRAVFELLEALKYFNKKPKLYDALVLIRGGGSWESLMAFNNEVLAREIRKSKIPVICGVGHEGDITIADLVADFRASTPTGAAKKISENWIKAKEQVIGWEKTVLNNFGYLLGEKKQNILDSALQIKEGCRKILEVFQNYEAKINKGFNAFSYELEESKNLVKDLSKNILDKYQNRLDFLKELIVRAEMQIKSGDPKRQLKLGYSITFKQGKVIKSVKDLNKNDKLSSRFWDGETESMVQKVKLN